MKPTKQNCMGRVMRYKNKPNSTVFVVVGCHPADFVPHVYWNSPGFGIHAASLDEIEFCRAGTPLSDARSSSEKDKPWSTKVEYLNFKRVPVKCQ